MKSTSHFAMAQLIYSSMKARGIDLNLVPFVYGNICPDYSPKILINPHFTKTCTKNINERIFRLSKRHVAVGTRLDADYAVDLGMLCHFLCDFFCFAHSKDFAENLKQHFAYEDELDHFLQKNCFDLLDVDGSETLREFPSAYLLRNSVEKAKAEYTDHGYTYENDVLYAFDACINCIYSIVMMSGRAESTSRRSILQYDLSDLEFFRLAAFRLFLFRNRDSSLFSLNLDLSAL